MTIRLVEGAALVKGKGDTWRCRLISEGQGSSAFYPGDVLKEHGSTTFTKGMQVFLDHPTETELLERGGGRSIKDFAGTLMEDAEWVEEERALYSPIKFTPAVLPLVENHFQDIALSIDVREFELAEDAAGKKVVSSMSAHPLNNVAIVPRGGRDGKIVSLIESFRDNSGEPSVVPERKTMTPEEIKALSEGIVAALAPHFDSLKEALKPVEPEPKDDEVDIVAVVEAARDAELPVAARKRVVEAAKAGGDYKALIEAEVADVKEIKETALKESAANGVVHRLGGDTGNFTVGAWTR